MSHLSDPDPEHAWLVYTPHPRPSLFGSGSSFSDPSSALSLPQHSLSTSRRFEKISPRLLLETFVGLKRQRNSYVVWQQLLVAKPVRVLPHKCSFLPVARRGSRYLTRQAPYPEGVPRVVGVDDFAWTKRRRSGTILVDLETHRLLALLADCEVETVATWFRQHPDVQIVTRDRSQTFADAIRRGAPHALHIADRFHLHMNAMTCLETLLEREQATIRRVAAGLRGSTPKRSSCTTPHAHSHLNGSGTSDALVGTLDMSKSSNGSAQGWSQQAIAQETGLHRQTVAIYLKAGQFPERAPHPSRSRVIEPYLEYLQKRWEQGEHNGRLLFEEIRA